MTYASAGRLYGYRGVVKPDHAQLEDVVEAIDHRHVALNPANRTVQFRHPGYISIRAALCGLMRLIVASQSFNVSEAPRRLFPPAKTVAFLTNGSVNPKWWESNTENN